MTDNEIIKVLECCGGNSCSNCRASEKECTDIIKNALDLINRQKAENERLCIEIDELIIAKDQLFDEAEALIKKAKSEAIKGFAERVKLLNQENLIIWNEQIDNLVKEMVGEDG